MFDYKPLQFGFIILCHDDSSALAKTTIKSLIRNYPKQSCLCMVNGKFPKDQQSEIEKICLVQKGKQTFSSLINKGMKKTQADWNFIVMAGAWCRDGLDVKFSRFVDNEKDILFPIVEGKTNFVDATLNGLFIHKQTFSEIGPWPEIDSFEECKIIWGHAAIQKGCRFKAIYGPKII